MTGVRRVAGSRHLIAGSCVAALAAAFAATEAAAQRPVFSSGIDLVHVGVTIIDDDGNLVTDLTADDFEVLEDGQTQEIRYFSVGLESDADVIPLHLGLLFDMSESMDRSERFQKTAAIRFLNTLTYAADMTVVDFDSEVRVGRYGQDDFGRLIERIRNRRPRVTPRCTMRSASISTVRSSRMAVRCWCSIRTARTPGASCRRATRTISCARPMSPCTPSASRSR